MSETYMQDIMRELIDEELTRQDVGTGTLSKEVGEQWDIVNHFMLEMLEIASRVDKAITEGSRIEVNELLLEGKY